MTVIKGSRFCLDLVIFLGINLLLIYLQIDIESIFGFVLLLLFLETILLSFLIFNGFYFELKSEHLIIKNQWLWWLKTIVNTSEIQKIELKSESKMGAVLIIHTLGKKLKYGCNQVPLNKFSGMISYLKVKKIKFESSYKIKDSSK